jgi:polyhydroxyalkanoate synthesis repressor PhaR
MKPRAILIKKYENRRLYDTINSRYVNLEDVAKLLQNGDSVRVVDAASGEDITRLVLTQIIVEDAKLADSTFPIEMLRQMVVASGRATQDGAVRYMQAMLDVYEKSYRALAPRFPFPGAAGSRHGEAPMESAAGGMDSAPLSREKAPDENIDDLKRRLAELEALVARLSSSPKEERKQPKRQRS